MTGGGQSVKLWNLPGSSAGSNASFAGDAVLAIHKSQTDVVWHEGLCRHAVQPEKAAHLHDQVSLRWSDETGSAWSLDGSAIRK